MRNPQKIIQSVQLNLAQTEFFFMDSTFLYPHKMFRKSHVFLIIQNFVLLISWKKKKLKKLFIIFIIFISIHFLSFVIVK